MTHTQNGRAIDRVDIVSCHLQPGVTKSVDFQFVFQDPSKMRHESLQSCGNASLSSSTALSTHHVQSLNTGHVDQFRSIYSYSSETSTIGYNGSLNDQLIEPMTLLSQMEDQDPVTTIKDHEERSLEEGREIVIEKRSSSDGMAVKRATVLMRPLCAGDYDKGYLDLLRQLTKVGHMSRDAFEKRALEIAASPNQIVIVAEDRATSKVVASASLIVELKFIHNCGKAGHIEDVVVDSNYRGMRLGMRLVEELLFEAKKRGCYKTILNCTDEFVPFYEKCGFHKRERQMRFDH